VMNIMGPQPLMAAIRASPGRNIPRTSPISRASDLPSEAF
jgi:hypothetical protein